MIGFSSQSKSSSVLPKANRASSITFMKNVSFLLAPLNREEVFDMMREVKSYPLLTGFRGSKPVDIEKLPSTVMELSGILLEIEEIQEIEIVLYLLN